MKKIKLQSKLRPEITTYFQFFASKEYPLCFWHTFNGVNEGFELSRISEWEPIGTTWEEIKKNSKEQ